MSTDPPAPSSDEPSGALPPSDSTPFTFACRCLNVVVEGRVSSTEENKVNESRTGSEKVKNERLDVYLPAGAEKVKLAGYVNYDQEHAESAESETTSEDKSDDKAQAAWRKCWICLTRTYKVSQGKSRTGSPAKDDWVVVELQEGVLYKDALEHALKQDSLPFSHLLLETPLSTSSFGRPPSNVAPSPYPNSSTSPEGGKALIPSPHDPFFLPPPFIPSHPQLRDLCDQAGDYLKIAHAKLEDHVRQYIVSKAQEMRELEEKVRSEVEMLWEKYKEGPDYVEEAHRSRSASTSRSATGDVQRQSGVTEPTRPLNDTNDNPLSKAAASPSGSIPRGGSLLAQSLSANTFYAPPPPSTLPASIKDEVDDTINHVASTYNKKDDNRAVAMSYVFSSLADHMGSSVSGSASHGRRKSSTSKIIEEDLHDKDSWADDERLNAGLLTVPGTHMDAVEEEEVAEGRTPRPRAVKQLYSEEKVSKGKGKEKVKVKFEEPAPAVVKNDDEKSDQEEYVFDFELDDSSPAPLADNAAAPLPATANVAYPRTRNMVEANLSHTFAADAPSHRAAWRRIEQNGSLYATLRRGSSSTLDEDGAEDESQISKLAMSMPMAIHLPKTKTRAQVVEFERKTSLSEREGKLVPPLLKAMRERGIPEPQPGSNVGGNSLGLGVPTSGPRGRLPSNNDTPRNTSRSASVSREREQVKSYAADPGAIFESLADDDDDDEDGNDDGDEEEGTLRDHRGFVPPHVLARKEDREALPDVGWRSLAS
ncbi:hypothetical protein CI109_103449 [Kwoniella shandongensis]|uniref:Uncharacterized protein n=1 Tax=Kwoniella shandongensis TaxID=1734106 RepID=A0A5M6BYZ1_9TREE|nr:uncharacterized protein CI109_004648 [Kwoniella shandongensis]KAA5527112.1 hypothetical protein CI109_004648 [Kwoniella shandongensis]